MEKLQLTNLIDFILEENKNYDDAECVRRWMGERKDKHIDEKYEEIFKGMIEEFLDYIAINEGDDIELYSRITEEGNDIWNDKNKDGTYFCDLASERADSQVDIYNYDLRESAPIFQEDIEERISSVGIEGCGLKEGGLIKLFQGGQYNFYNRIANEILNACQKYFEGLETKGE